jgi:hypothetical protein
LASYLKKLTMQTSSLSLPLSLLLAGLLIAFESEAQEPGSPKTLRPSDAVSDAAGTGQLFECIQVPNVTDFVQGLNSPRCWGCILVQRWRFFLDGSDGRRKLE